MWTLESKVTNNVADAIKSEGADKVDNSFKDTLAQFKSGVTIYCGGSIITKDFFPDEVYKFLLANHAVKNAPEIKNIDGTLIKEMETYIAGILGTEGTVPTKDGNSYTVSALFIDAGLATVTDNDTGRQYNITWRSDAAKETLYGLLRNLKTWGQNFQTYFFSELKKDVRDDLLIKWFKALLNNNGYVAREVYETIDDYLEAGGDATDIPSFAADNYSKWLKWLSNLTKKYFPDTNSKVADFQKIFQTLDDRAKDTALLGEYKDGSEDLTASTIKGYDSYKKFIAAYNTLQTAIGQESSNFDSLIPNYIGYEITDVVSGTFSESNATIICTDGANDIKIEGSNVTVDAGRGNDFIVNQGSNVTIDVGAGDDSIYSHGSDGSIFGGAVDDEILSNGGYVGRWRHGRRYHCNSRLKRDSLWRRFFRLSSDKRCLQHSFEREQRLYQ